MATESEDDNNNWLVKVNCTTLVLFSAFWLHGKSQFTYFAKETIISVSMYNIPKALLPLPVYKQACPSVSILWYYKLSPSSAHLQ